MYTVTLIGRYYCKLRLKELKKFSVPKASDRSRIIIQIWLIQNTWAATMFRMYSVTMKIVIP